MSVVVLSLSSLTTQQRFYWFSHIWIVDFFHRRIPPWPGTFVAECISACKAARCNCQRSRAEAKEPPCPHVSSGHARRQGRQLRCCGRRRNGWGEERRSATTATTKSIVMPDPRARAGLTESGWSCGDGAENNIRIWRIWERRGAAKCAERETQRRGCSSRNRRRRVADSRVGALKIR